METIKVRADRSATRLLDITFWSNLSLILILAVINAVDFIQAAAGKETLVNLASPQVVLLASIALAAWLVSSCYRAYSTKMRMKKVFVSLTEDGVEGYSLPHPAQRGKGEAFALPYREILAVSIVEVPISSRNDVPSLQVGNAKSTYITPAPEKLRELVKTIADRMPSSH